MSEGYKPNQEANNRRNEENRRLRTMILDLCRGVEGVAVSTEKNNPVADINRLYEESDAKALQFLFNFNKVVSELISKVGSTQQDVEQRAFIFSAEDVRQVGKAISIFKGQVSPVINALRKKMTTDINRGRAYATLRNINDPIEEKIKENEANLAQLEIILVAQPQFSEQQS